MGKRIFSTLFALSLIASILIPVAVYAQTPTDGINLQISPLPIELNTKPGTSTGADLRVRNVGAKTEKLQVRLLAVSEDNNGQVHLTNPTSTDEWVKWVSFDRQTFDSPSNQWQTVKMKIDVPKIKNHTNSCPPTLWLKCTAAETFMLRLMAIYLSPKAANR
jgi:hypothetical protein